MPNYAREAASGRFSVCYKQIETSVQKMQTQKSTDIKVTDKKRMRRGQYGKRYDDRKPGEDDI